MLGTSEAGLPGLGGSGWRRGTDWALGAGRNRATVRAVASVPSGGLRPPGVAPPADPAPGPAGAATAAWPGQPGPEGSGAVPAVEEMEAGAVDLCPRAGGRADQQSVRARPAPGRAVAEGQLRVRQ